MPLCPYCEGEVSETARKCKHCGEWLSQPASPAGDDAKRSDLGQVFGSGEDSLGRAANRQVSFNMVMGVLVIGVMLIVVFFVFIPLACERNNSIPGLPGERPFFSP